MQKAGLAFSRHPIFYQSSTPLSVFIGVVFLTGISVHQFPRELMVCAGFVFFVLFFGLICIHLMIWQFQCCFFDAVSLSQEYTTHVTLVLIHLSSCLCFPPTTSDVFWDARLAFHQRCILVSLDSWNQVAFEKKKKKERNWCVL